VEPAELVPRPTDALCVVRGQVSRNDVTWRLRTRLDAVPTLQVYQGAVTAWLQASPGIEGDGPNAVVEVESTTMRVRARVAWEDLVVVLASPLVARGTYIPDARTDRRVTDVEAGKLSLDIGMPGVGSVVMPVSCDAVGLERKDLDVGALLPPAGKETTVRRDAQIRTAERDLPVSRFALGHGSSVPPGVPAIVRERRGGRTLISIAACGGTVFGTIAAGDDLGPSRASWGSNFHCENTGEHVFLAPRPLTRRKRCPADVPLLVRSRTLEDVIGVLEAGAMFRVDGQESGATTLITVAEPPVSVIKPAHLAVHTRDLATCADVPDDGG